MISKFVIFHFVKFAEVSINSRILSFSLIVPTLLMNSHKIRSHQKGLDFTTISCNYFDRILLTNVLTYRSTMWNLKALRLDTKEKPFPTFYGQIQDFACEQEKDDWHTTTQNL